MADESIFESRVIELEAKLVYQEDTLNELSEAFYLQQKQIAKMEIQQKALLEKIRNLQSDDKQARIVDEKPPHY